MIIVLAVTSVLLCLHLFLRLKTIILAFLLASTFNEILSDKVRSAPFVCDWDYFCFFILHGLSRQQTDSKTKTSRLSQSLASSVAGIVAFLFGVRKSSYGAVFVTRPIISRKYPAVRKSFVSTIIECKKNGIDYHRTDKCRLSVIDWQITDTSLSVKGQIGTFLRVEGKGNGFP